MRKKWTTLAIPLMVIEMLFLTACKDDEEGENQESDIIGTWNFQEVDFEIAVNGQDFIDYVIEVFELTEAEAQELKDTFEESMEDWSDVNLTFNSDQTFTSSGPDGNESGTWQISGDGETLTMTSDGESQDLVIETLTKDDLILSFFEEEEDEDWDGDGQNELFSVTITLELEK